jgi:hypothetical protein
VRFPDCRRDGRGGLLRGSRRRCNAPAELRGIGGLPASQAVDIGLEARDVGLEAEDVGDEGALGLFCLKRIFFEGRRRGSRLSFFFPSEK